MRMGESYEELVKQMVVGVAVLMTLAASETLAYAKEKGVSGTWTLSLTCSCGGVYEPPALKSAASGSYRNNRTLVASALM
jgi:hypothetical protein